MPGIVDEAGIFVAALGIEHQRQLFHQHVRKADNGVERRAQFVAHGGEEAALGGIGALGLAARVLQRLLLPLAFRHIAKHGNDFAAVIAATSTAACSSGRQRISIQTNSACTAIGVGTLAPDAELDGAALAQGRCIAERGQISGAVGDMDAAEQALPVQVDDTAAEQRLRRRRHEQHGAIAAVAVITSVMLRAKSR